MAVVEKTVDIIGDERFTAMLLAKTIPDDCPVDLYDEVVQSVRNGSKISGTNSIRCQN